MLLDHPRRQSGDPVPGGAGLTVWGIANRGCADRLTVRVVRSGKRELERRRRGDGQEAKRRSLRRRSEGPRAVNAQAEAMASGVVIEITMVFGWISQKERAISCTMVAKEGAVSPFAQRSPADGGLLQDPSKGALATCVIPLFSSQIDEYGLTLFGRSLPSLF
jgi:hypothetical protein